MKKKNKITKEEIILNLCKAIIPVASYLFILLIFWAALANPEANIKFIYNYAVFIFIAEFIGIHSTGFFSSSSSVSFKILLIFVYLFFIVTFSLVFAAYQPAIILALSIIAKAFNKNSMMSGIYAANFLLFIGTTFLVVFGSFAIYYFIPFSEEVLSQAPRNASGLFVEVPQTLIVWGLIYFTSLIVIQILFAFKKNNGDKKIAID